jgi:maltooligosyltrehalose trehalohydrolase
VLGFDNDRVLLLRRWSGSEAVLTIFNFKEAAVPLALPSARGQWRRLLDSSEPCWDGPGGSLPPRFESAGSVELRLPPTSVTLFERVNIKE